MQEAIEAGIDIHRLENEISEEMVEETKSRSVIMHHQDGSVIKDTKREQIVVKLRKA